MYPFHWLDSATVSIAATTAGTDRAQLLKMPTGQTQLRFYNSGTVTVFIRKGMDAAVTAAVTDLPIAPGAVEVLTVQNSQTAPVTHIAAVTASGAATLYITTGAGI